MAPLMCAAQEECLEAGGPLTSVTSPEHSCRPRTMPCGARFAPLVGDDDPSSVRPEIVAFLARKWNKELASTIFPSRNRTGSIAGPWVDVRMPIPD
jgi:hypothetical protein